MDGLMETTQSGWGHCLKIDDSTLSPGAHEPKNPNCKRNLVYNTYQPSKDEAQAQVRRSFQGLEKYAFQTKTESHSKAMVND